jgi:cytochrome c553
MTRNSYYGMRKTPLILVNAGRIDVSYGLFALGQSSIRGYRHMRVVLILLTIISFFIGPTWSQDVTLNADDVQKGHFLASTICAICHVAAPDQSHQPIMKPPAPSFASIVRQKKYDAESLTHFMKTTHRGLDNPLGMPNPDLMDYQIKQIVAYFLSLYK